MKRIRHAAVFSTAVVIACSAQAGRTSRAPVAPAPATHGRNQESAPVLVLDFERSPVGLYTESDLREAWPNSTSIRFSERTRIIADTAGNRSLQVAYPKGTFGPKENGALFIATLPAADEYYLTYRVRFSESFDFRKGGKLPGLSSGGGRYSGGRIPTKGDGWSARLTFGPGGKASVYLYHVDMKGPWGETLALNSVFQPGRWHTITQRVRINTEGSRDAVLQVWLDGQLRLDRTNLRLGLAGKGKVDSLCFSTFHGGSRSEFAPLNDGQVLFDDFVINTQPPAQPARY
jgi:hypothetical protein